MELAYYSPGKPSPRAFKHKKIVFSLKCNENAIIRPYSKQQTIQARHEYQEKQMK